MRTIFSRLFREYALRANALLFLIFASFLFIPLVSTQTYAIACCIDANTQACTEGEITNCVGELYPTICRAVEENGVPLCQSGCCCATPSANNPDEWNLNEENLVMNAAQCQTLGSDYAWQGLTQASCVAQCFGDTGGPGGSGNTFTVRGIVTDSEGLELDLATVYIPVVGSTYQDTTSDDGRYQITLPQVTGNIIATHMGCLPKSQPIVVDADKTVNIELSCEQSACVPARKPTITATNIRGTNKALLTFTADDRCGEREYYHVVREQEVDGEAGPTIVLEHIQTNQFEDENLLPNTKYCYKVAAKYPNGLYPAALDEREESCITTGDEACMQEVLEDVEWCGRDPQAILSCDENNILDVRECGEGQVCAPAGNGRFACVAQPPCDQCNGPFGFLSNIVYSIWHGGVARACTSSELRNFCYKDKTLTTTDAYTSCAQTSSCEDYKSQTACTANPCSVQASCSWTTLFSETGTGVCTSDPPKCELCEDIFGGCTKELCQAIGGGAQGDCYFDGLDNNLQYTDESRCVSKQNMACRYYDTQQECTGGSQSAVDVRYTQDERSSGTNQVTVQSRDVFSFGVCKWNAAQEEGAEGKCYKDADQRASADPEDDCIESGVYGFVGRDCLVDSTPPTTQLILSGDTIGTHELSSIEYVVADNYYRNSDLETFFCIDQSGACYPRGTLTQAMASLPDMDIGDVESFHLRYYSVDLSDNLEVVQDEEISLIELGVPRITNAELRG